MPPIRKALIVPFASSYRHYPASSAMPSLLFPLVDRDGLTKPVIQIVAEEAIESGIESVGVVVPPGLERTCREYFRRWQQSAASELRGHDWAAIQSHKLGELGERLTFIPGVVPAEIPPSDSPANPSVAPILSENAASHLLSGQTFVPMSRSCFSRPIRCI